MREGGEEWRRKGEVGGGGEGMWRGWRGLLVYITSIHKKLNSSSTKSFLKRQHFDPSNFLKSFLKSKELLNPSSRTLFLYRRL